MKYDRKTDKCKLRSGREFYAYLGLLSTDGKGLFYGYDSDVSCEGFTLAERLEIAAHAIAGWLRWARRARREKGKDG